MSGEPPKPMSDQRFRQLMLVLPLVSLLIAVMSMVSSFFQSYNYARNISTVQQNVLRAENLRTCKEIIDVFFQFRLRAEDLNAATDKSNAESQTRELRSLVYKFGALGTFLANFRDEPVRQRYSKLSWELEQIARGAATLAPAEFTALFAAADATFGSLNEDCVSAAQNRLL
jgi:flagellar basal body-associated protein FliL